MKSNTELFSLSSALPGYLFVLAALSDLHDVVSLDCPGTVRSFFAAMLAKIGLSVQGPATEATRSKADFSLKVCKDMQDLPQLPLVEGEGTTVVLFPYQTAMPEFERFAEQFLPLRPDCILVNGLQDQTASKSFVIAVSRECRSLVRLEKNMVKYKLN